MIMSKTANLSTVVDARVKEAATAFCKRHGIKLSYFIEQALLEQLEDEIDLEAYRTRKNEKTIPLEDILAARKS
jgi:antitoxin component of RelBE/YafQ-DinJ toxin-antitoxin module